MIKLKKKIEFILKETEYSLDNFDKVYKKIFFDTYDKPEVMLSKKEIKSKKIWIKAFEIAECILLPKYSMFKNTELYKSLTT